MEPELSKNSKLTRTTRLVVQLLVGGHYDSIAELDGSKRVSAEAISDTINCYGPTLVLPPEESYECIDAIQIENKTPAAWSVTFGLWTKEEGRSDLSVVLTLAESQQDYMDVDFDDILVL